MPPPRNEKGSFPQWEVLHHPSRSALQHNGGLKSPPQPAPSFLQRLQRNKVLFSELPYWPLTSATLDFNKLSCRAPFQERTGVMRRKAGEEAARQLGDSEEMKEDEEKQMSQRARPGSHHTVSPAVYRKGKFSQIKNRSKTTPLSPNSNSAMNIKCILRIRSNESWPRW